MLPNRMTIREKYDPAMAVTTPGEALEYLAALITRYQRVVPGASEAEAREVEENNVGYWTGYLSREERARLEELYGIAHPILGAAAGPPVSQEECFERGAALARRGLLPIRGRDFLYLEIRDVLLENMEELARTGRVWILRVPVEPGEEVH